MNNSINKSNIFDFLTRFFIIWYQILGENAPESVHAIFATIVPGFVSPIEGYEGLEFFTKGSAAGTFYNDSKYDTT